MGVFPGLVWFLMIIISIQLLHSHNGNILMDNQGHLIHIDFGFILSNSPKSLGFESSPFKLTQEFVEVSLSMFQEGRVLIFFLQVMGGPNSQMFEYYKSLLLRGLLTARKHHDRILTLVEILITSPSMASCFTNPASIMRSLRDRFHMNMTEEALRDHLHSMVVASLNSLTTKLYDGFQYFTNGIF